MPIPSNEGFEIINRKGEGDWLSSLLGEAISAHELVGIYVNSLRRAHEGAAESKDTHIWKDDGTFGYDRYKAIIHGVSGRARSRGIARLNSTQSFVLPFGAAQVYTFRFGKDSEPNVYSCRLPKECAYIRRSLKRGRVRQIPMFAHDGERAVTETVLVPWVGDSVAGLISVYFGQATLTEDDYLDWYNLAEIKLDVQIAAHGGEKAAESKVVGESPHSSTPPPNINFNIPEE